MFGPRVLDAHVSRRDGAGNQVGAAFDAIGQHLVVHAREALHALDDDAIGTGTVNVRTHGDQEIGQIYDFRFARGILEHRLAVGEAGGHHQIFGAGDGHGLEHQPRTLEPLRARADVAALDVYVRAHRLQAGHVDVDRPRTDGAAPGQRHVGAPEAREQRPEHQDRGTHGLDQLVRRKVFANGPGIDLDAHALVDGHGHAHAAEQLDGRGDVLQVRHVADRYRPVGQQCAGQNRQRRVLGTGYADFTLERNAARYLQLIHEPRGPARRAPPIPAGCRLRW